LIKDDPKKGKAAYARHIACFVASFHGSTATISCIIITLVKGLTFSLPSEEIHNIAIAVRIFPNSVNLVVFYCLLFLRHHLRNLLQV
jgi:hypothetical protein